MEAAGHPVVRRSPPTMKNFARLVRFAWPYRGRFALSLVCAVLVALLYFADIMAVYPLLQILTKSQNGQKWVAETIETVEGDIRALDAQRGEVAYVREHLSIILKNPREGGA